MKISLLLSALILIAAILLGVHDRRRLVTLQNDHENLVVTASRQGIHVDPNHTDASLVITKRQRGDHGDDLKAFALSLIAFNKEMQVLQESGGSPDAGQRERQREMIERISLLGSAQLQTLIREFSTTNGIDDEIRQNLVIYAMMQLARVSPQAALVQLTGHSDIVKKSGMGERIVATALTAWSKDNPLAALGWVRKNSTKYPEFVTTHAKKGMIAGAATKGPAVAFKLVDELGADDRSNLISEVVSTAKSPEERTIVFTELRKHLATIKDVQTKDKMSQRAFENFASNIIDEGFETGTEWINKMNFSPPELQGLADGMYGPLTNDEAGKWIQWLGEKLPPASDNRQISQLVNFWTERDYQAAGKWLSTLPEGPTRITAIRTYASTIAPHEPEIAGQWASILPPGTEREQTLHRVYSQWPAADPNGKAAFQKEHGIK